MLYTYNIYYILYNIYYILSTIYYIAWSKCRGTYAVHQPHAKGLPPVEQSNRKGRRKHNWQRYSVACHDLHLYHKEVLRNALPELLVQLLEVAIGCRFKLKRPGPHWCSCGKGG